MKHEELIEAYLQDLDRALDGLDPAERGEVVSGVREHIETFLAGDPVTEDRVRQVLDNLGPVDRIAQAACAGQTFGGVQGGPGQGVGQSPTVPVEQPVEESTSQQVEEPLPHKASNAFGPFGSLVPETDGQQRQWALAAAIFVAAVCLIGLLTHPYLVVLLGSAAVLGVFVYRVRHSLPLLIVAGMGAVVFGLLLTGFFFTASTTHQNSSDFSSVPGASETSEPTASPSGSASPSPSGTVSPSVTRTPTVRVTITATPTSTRP